MYMPCKIVKSCNGLLGNQAISAREFDACVYVFLSDLFHHRKFLIRGIEKVIIDYI